MGTVVLARQPLAVHLGHASHRLEVSAQRMKKD